MTSTLNINQSFHHYKEETSHTDHSLHTYLLISHMAGIQAGHKLKSFTSIAGSSMSYQNNLMDIIVLDISIIV